MDDEEEPAGGDRYARRAPYTIEDAIAAIPFFEKKQYDETTPWTASSLSFLRRRAHPRFGDP